LIQNMLRTKQNTVSFSFFRFLHIKASLTTHCILHSTRYVTKLIVHFTLSGVLLLKSVCCIFWQIITETLVCIRVHRSYNRSNMKIIYVPSGLSGLPSGRLRFTQYRCPVDACTLTAKSKYDRTADVRLLRGDAFFDAGYSKPSGQVWVLWLLESPINTPRFSHAEGLINWTATYRPDSTIVTPYDKYEQFSHLHNSLRLSAGKWPYPPFPEAPRRPRQLRYNHAAGKSRLVAWFVSNCVAANRRYEFVQQLRQHIPVDVYGDCGSLGCPRNDQPKCDTTLSLTYKFYLSFENSNCEHYVTEKFFHNALWFVQFLLRRL